MKTYLPPTPFRLGLLLASIPFLILPLHAQQAIPAAGGNYQSSDGSVSFSVGQVFYENFSFTGGSIAQGVQQPYEISIVSEVEEVRAVALSLTAYPNPAGDYLILQIEGEWKAPHHIYLYDINGKLLQNLTVTSRKTRLDMKGYKPAVYLLKVTDGRKEVKVFRIVKN